MISQMVQRVGGLLLVESRKKGMTQRELAKGTGISQPTVFRILRGKLAPSLHQLLSLMSVLNLSWEDLKQRDVKPPNAVWACSGCGWEKPAGVFRCAGCAGQKFHLSVPK